MDKDIVKKAVLEAVKEYNNTIQGKNSTFLQKRSYDEKRGIFYNSLRRNIRHYLSSYSLDTDLTVDKIICHFRLDHSLEKFYITDWSGKSWDFSNDADFENSKRSIVSMIAEQNGNVFLNSVINVDLERIKNFKFYF